MRCRPLPDTVTPWVPDRQIPQARHRPRTKALDAHPRTGQRRWTGRHFLFNMYQDAELGYAVTDHIAQGRTVTAGLAVITGAEDRPHALVA